MNRSVPKLLVLSFVLLLPALAAASGASAGQQAKVPLTHDVYDAWRSISGEKLSDDGRWLLYAEVPQEGDAELVVRDLVSGAEHRHSLGWINAGSGFGRPEAEFVEGSGYVVFLASPAMTEVKKARKDKAKPDDMPKKILGILDLSDGTVATVERVKSFGLADESGTHVAYLLEKPLPEKQEEPADEAGTEPETTTPEPEVIAEPEPVAEPAQEPAGPEAEDSDEKKKEKDYGTELVVRALGSGEEVRVQSVLEYAFVDDGARLFYTVSSEDDPASDGLYALGTGDGATSALLSGEGNYKRLAMNENQTRVAFLSDRNDYTADEPAFELFGMAIDGSAAELWVSHASTEGFPDGMAVSDKEPVSFTDDGAMVVFSIKERPAQDGDGDGDEDGEESEGEDDSEDKAQFDLWHWNDPYPQPQQLVMADEVKNEAYESVWHVDARRFVQLADEAIPDVTVSANGAVAFATTGVAWTRRGSYEDFYEDVYVIDLATGDRTLVQEQVSFGATLSPQGRYVAWYGGDGEWIGYDRNGGGGWSGGMHWFLYDVASGERRNLTGPLDVPFARQDHDTPNLASSYGVAGFTEGDEALLVYDEFDIWGFPTAGGDPWLVTGGGVGRRTHTSFRYQRLDPEQDAVPATGLLVLNGTDTETMATGFWADSLSASDAPTQLLAAGADLTFRDLADEASSFLYTRQTFREFPDLWVGQLQLGGDATADSDSDVALADVRKVSSLGAQTEPYIWGNAELRDFRSADGLPLKGILIKPDNFDPEQQYPLMVYIYETLHQGLHGFRNPSPGTSINPSYYVSNGYVLWMPDIEYVTPGYPGKDAMKCVLPGINMLLAEGYIDEDAIGIQGHSWGGYQISYMVTQTDVFAAAEAGAPVSNMTSAYGGIRWDSGLVRQFQYERTQSRLGASLWDVPLRYVENSPLFWADEIDTPLLIMHNDKDGAVPWYQGIEFIMALRRLGKEAYMFNYNGEPHGLRQRPNQEDWTVRMQQFFDHHLRGAPAPEWMTQGIKGWEKGEVER